MPHHRCLLRVLAAASLSLGCLASDAMAASPPWPATPQPYVVIDQDLEGVLREFGHQTHTRVEIHPDVEGRVRGSWPSLTPRGFLEELATRHEFTWYYDGDKLSITPADRSESRVISLGGVKAENLTAALDRLGVADDRFPLRINHDSGIAMASGPPRFIELIDVTFRSLQSAIPKVLPVKRNVAVIHGRALQD